MTGILAVAARVAPSVALAIPKVARARWDGLAVNFLTLAQVLFFRIAHQIRCRNAKCATHSNQGGYSGLADTALQTVYKRAVNACLKGKFLLGNTPLRPVPSQDFPKNPADVRTVHAPH